MVSKKGKAANQGQAHASSSKDTMESTSVNVTTDHASTSSTIAPDNKLRAPRKQKGALPPSAKTEQLPQGSSQTMTVSNDQPMCTPDAGQEVEAVIKVPITKVSILKFNRMVIKGLTVR